MTLLTTIQDAAQELGLVKPSTVVTNTSDLVAQQLLAFFNRVGIRLRSDYDWPVLTKEYTFTLTSGTAAYAMPGDFERFATCTHWNRNSNWEVVGPIAEAEWQYLKSSGLTSGYPRQRWRFKDCTTNQFYIDPTPDASADGNTLVFEYYRKNWLRPVLWTASTAFSAGTYCFYNGNWYSTSAGGTTGSTAPTHTSGSVSDGAVTWAYFSTPFERGTADTNVSLLPEHLITMGIKWMFRQAKNLEGWEVMRGDFEAEARKLSSANRGSAPIDLNAAYRMSDFTYPKTPDFGFGS